MKAAFQWTDYQSEYAAVLDSWLDEQTVRATGLDEGFEVFYQYWKREADPPQKKYFCCKIVSEERQPVAVVAFSYYQQTVVIMEIVVDPIRRGQGRGTAILNELVDQAENSIGQPISVFEAVIFPNNAVSKNAFYKAGFVPASDEKENDRWRKPANDEEFLFQGTSKITSAAPDLPIRWFSPAERGLFNEHLRLCQQKKLSKKQWNKTVKAGVRYCGIFIDGKPVARACIEKLTDRYWEISDVRVVNDCRKRGYATAICGFVADEIGKNGKIPTIRTGKDNAAMRRVIQKLDFHPMIEKDHETI